MFAPPWPDHIFAQTSYRYVPITKFPIAIEAYESMREAAYQIDPTTNTYCFVKAAGDNEPENLYRYSLPVGIKLPKRNVTPV
jgi:hypothetical protein